MYWPEGKWAWTYDGSSDYSVGPEDDPQAGPIGIHDRDPDRGAARCQAIVDALNANGAEFCPFEMPQEELAQLIDRILIEARDSIRDGGLEQSEYAEGRDAAASDAHEAIENARDKIAAAFRRATSGTANA